MRDIEIAVGFFLFLAMLLLSVVYHQVIRKKTLSPYDAALDQMVNGFDVEMPVKEIEEYKRLKSLGNVEKKEICSALFRRAVAVIPLIHKLQSESQGMQKMRRNDFLRESSYKSFARAEAMIENELKEISAEAEMLRPEISWGKSIFAQANQVVLHLEKQAEEVERKKKDALDEKRRKAEEEQAARAEEQALKAQKEREEKQREKAIEFLLKEANQSKKTN